MSIRQVTSKSNPWFKQLKELVIDNTAYREHQTIWLEGDHLCKAAINRGWTFDEMVLNDSVNADEIAFWRKHSQSITLLPGPLVKQLSALSSAAWIGGIVKRPLTPMLDPNVSTVVLDRLQDPGNVGSILRSAAAFGFTQVVTTPHTVALWSAKVVRSGMGAHFGISLLESMPINALLATNLPVLVTSSHHGSSLKELVRDHKLPSPCMWVLGHEGQGASNQWFEAAHVKVCIDQPGGEESLNVAAAAAICLHASACL